MQPSDFQAYCEDLTDSQLLHVIDKEDEGRKRDPDREADYRDACTVADRRGLSY